MSLSLSSSFWISLFESKFRIVIITLNLVKCVVDYFAHVPFCVAINKLVTQGAHTSISIASEYK